MATTRIRLGVIIDILCFIPKQARPAAGCTLTSPDTVAGIASMPDNPPRPAAFYGSIPALITPFRNGIVDERAFQSLVERQISEGSHALVPCGTTGESVTLSTEEHIRVVELCVEAAAGQVPVIAGAGSNNTAHAIELARWAKRAGADAVLVVAPYYNKPSQDGLVAHFTAIHDAVDIPIVVYNVPARTVTDISVETMGRLAKLSNVVGVKDASADLARVARHRALCGERFIQLSGEDPSAIGFNAHGGKGCISVTANVAPKLCAQMQEASLNGDDAAARAIDDKLAPLHKALFCEPSPAPAKYACSLLGLCGDELRLPLVPCSEAAKAQVKAAMTHAGLL
jgi:4-hydroxy-tetrahydrodipicolinate synthase